MLKALKHSLGQTARPAAPEVQEYRNRLGSTITVCASGRRQHCRVGSIGLTLTVQKREFVNDNFWVSNVLGAHRIASRKRS